MSLCFHRGMYVRIDVLALQEEDIRLGLSYVFHILETPRVLR